MDVKQELVQDFKINCQDLIYVHPNYNRKSAFGCHLIGIPTTQDKSEIYKDLVLRKINSYNEVIYDLTCENCGQSIFKFTLSECY